MDEVIKVEHLTKDYGDGKGIFDLSFTVKKGETFGFVGTNGSGKTTTIRHIMGFLKPEQGSAHVLGLDAWKNACEIKKFVEYVPGEIAFPDLRDGTTFLKAQAELLGIKDMSFANYLVERLQLDPSANLKRMSKGMKQKTAIVAAFMADKDILILDEPSTGLDPLMRETFVELLLAEKIKGKTILMSSQMFDELEGVCDRVALIFNGRIIDVADMKELTNLPYKTYKVEFLSREDYLKFKRLKYEIVRDQEKYNQVTIKVYDKDLNRLFNTLKNYNLKFISEVKYNLEKHFKEILAKEYQRQEEEKKRIEEEKAKRQELSEEELKQEKSQHKKAEKQENLAEKNEKFFNKKKEKDRKKADKAQNKEFSHVKKEFLKTGKKDRKLRLKQQRKDEKLRLKLEKEEDDV